MVEPNSRPGQSADGKEKRIAGEEGPDDQAGLAEDDGGQEEVHAGWMIAGKGVEVHVEVANKVEALFDQFKHQNSPMVWCVNRTGQESQNSEPSASWDGRI